MTAELFCDELQDPRTDFRFWPAGFCIEGDENLRAGSDEGQFHIFGAMLLKAAADFHTIAEVKQMNEECHCKPRRNSPFGSRREGV